MPVITISLNDLKSLVPHKLTDTQLQDLLPQIKVEVDSFGPELVLEVTPDRPDLFSAEGIARQLILWLGLQKGLPRYTIKSSGIRITTKHPTVRPFMISAIIRGLDLTGPALESLLRLQAQLDATLGRNRRTVSIGLHDFSKTKPPYIYQDVAPTAVSFVPLDSKKEMTPAAILMEYPKGKEYAHLVPRNCPLLTDKNGSVLSFPPIINGELTRVKETTKDLLIDITGTDQLAMEQSLNILVTALAMRGGKIESVAVDKKSFPTLEPQRLTINKHTIMQQLGIDLKNSELKELLQRMGYAVTAVQETFTVLAPPYRADLWHPVDVTEDVAIAYGYNNLTPVHPNLFSVGHAHPLETFCQRLRELAVSMGFIEVNTFALTGNEPPLNSLSGKAIDLENPMSSETSTVRTNLLGSLVQVFAVNKHNKYPQRIFELGDVVQLNQQAETKTDTKRYLAIGIAHQTAGFSEMLSVLNGLNTTLGNPWKIGTTTDPGFLPGRVGAIKLGGTVIGRFGELHPAILADLGLEVPVVVCELFVEPLVPQPRNQAGKS
ncbi:MAG: phenylalanine--tRNA ligase subunit beta [Nanoarchaeota archaeon]|nr:phenylalanine--tRNA ligase subunit beta [Nanoarchaeota archaeon]